MFHPGAIAQVPMKIFVFTQRYSQKENWRNRLSASQMKHQYEATYGKRILHSFLLKEKKNIFNDCTSQRQGTEGTVYPFTKSGKCVLLQASFSISLTTLVDTASTVLKIWFYI